MIDLLRNNQNRPIPAPIDNRKLPELKAEAKRLRLNNYSRLRKQDLIDLLRNQNRSIPVPRTKKKERPKLSPKEIERKIKRLKKKLRTINQKIKNNKKKKCNHQQKHVKSQLEKELPEKFKPTELANALRGFARQF